jgi:hypothetical protein
VAARAATGSPRPAEETRTTVSLLFMWLGLICGWGCRLAGRAICPFAFGFNLVGQRVDQDRSAEVDAALLLAQRAYWIYLAGATGRYEAREQRSGQKDRNHDRKSR